MKMIIGLGNPGGEYARTRHNVGFMAVDELAKRYDGVHWQDKFDALHAPVLLGGEKTLLVKPQTYMNLSGAAAAALLRWYKMAPEDVIVIYDDMDLPVGGARIRVKGSSGGHRGMNSLLEYLGTPHFTRLRIGIGRPAEGRTAVDHVLKPFSAAELAELAPVLAKTPAICECIIKEGAEAAVRRFPLKKAAVKDGQIGET